MSLHLVSSFNRDSSMLSHHKSRLLGAIRSINCCIYWALRKARMEIMGKRVGQREEGKDLEICSLWQSAQGLNLCLITALSWLWVNLRPPPALREVIHCRATSFNSFWWFIAKLVTLKLPWNFLGLVLKFFSCLSMVKLGFIVDFFASFLIKLVIISSKIFFPSKWRPC